MKIILPNRKPNRMKDYDYSNDNLYFVTSCVHDRVCCFGHIIRTGRDPSLQYGDNKSDVSDCDPSEKQIILNEYGKIAENQWVWLAKQYPYVILHEYVIMPNHMHGIIEITSSRIDGIGSDIGTGHDLSLQSIKIKSISELMGAYKTTTSNKIHLIGFDEFKWQRSFHDHIIRDKKSYDQITKYIINNPENWKDDEFFNSVLKSIQ